MPLLDKPADNIGELLEKLSSEEESSTDIIVFQGLYYLVGPVGLVSGSEHKINVLDRRVGPYDPTVDVDVVVG